ncbi:hypothetical protein BV20DRAFT_605976 [Pilatotrama ljubarskyi]|nr:hypothetical protein BV20DRAFT_605976 [Pilatotrama ljubarskyi]
MSPADAIVMQCRIHGHGKLLLRGRARVRVRRYRPRSRPAGTASLSDLVHPPLPPRRTFLCRLLTSIPCNCICIVIREQHTQCTRHRKARNLWGRPQLWATVSPYTLDPSITAVNDKPHHPSAKSIRLCKVTVAHRSR